MAGAEPYVTLAASALSAFSAYKGATQKPPEPSAVGKTPTAPIVGDKSKQRAAERNLARKYASQGRLSTVLSEGSGLG